MVENWTSLQNRMSFLDRSSMKCHLGRLHKHVDLGMIAAEKDLEYKKIKLKSQILREEADFTREFVDLAQKLAGKRLEEKKESAERILEILEKERKAQAQEKLLQLAKNDSDDAREQKSIIMQMEAIIGQKQQICENLKQKEREQEETQFWIDLEKKLYYERTRIEDDRELVRCIKNKETQDIWRKQNLGKELQKEEIKHIILKEKEFHKQLSKRIEMEKRKELEAKFKEKEELKNVMEEQCNYKRQVKARKKEEALEYDRLYADTLQRTFIEEKSKEKIDLQNKQHQARLTSEYLLQQLKNVRAARDTVEKEYEECRQVEINKKLAAAKRNFEITQAVKEQALREMLTTRKQQILEKQKILQREKEREENENKLSNCILVMNEEMDKKQEELIKRRKQRLAVDQAAQKSYENVQDARRRKEYEDFIVEQSERQRAKDELYHTFKFFDGEQHPFYKTLCKK